MNLHSFVLIHNTSLWDYKSNKLEKVWKSKTQLISSKINGLFTKIWVYLEKLYFILNNFYQNKMFLHEVLKYMRLFHNIQIKSLVALFYIFLSMPCHSFAKISNSNMNLKLGQRIGVLSMFPGKSARS